MITIFIQKYIFLIILLLLTACAPSFKSNQGHDLLPIVRDQKGYSLGLYDTNGDIEPKRTFKTKIDSFSKEISFYNQVKEAEFLLILFDHGLQKEFRVDNKETIAYSFSLKEGQSIKIPVTIENLNTGFHSINYVIIPNPEKVITDKDRIIQADQLSQIYTVKVNVLNNIDKIPSPPQDNFKEYKSTNSAIHGPFITKETENMSIWLQESISPEQQLSFYTHFGNSSSKEIDFYLISMLDWKQIPIYEDNNWVYSKLKPGEQKYFNSNVNVKQNDQTLVSFMLPNPFEELPDNQPYGSYPISSLRVKINYK